MEAFLNNKIKFVSIPKIVEKTLNKTSFYELNSIKDVIEADIEAREYASELIKTESNWFLVMFEILLNNIIPFVIILTILVFVHELGHYSIARYNDVKVEVFSIGFGKELLALQINLEQDGNFH